ncbi:winged helix-turn-helix transcriptional regulator [Nitriliruptor alkaliphilus]|uniref:winged helix-turn-helix transcriptional regulator n=1 Tax=Nitriliruptor alkaliphilus TaxID=427918 RepID=UPI000695D5C2|nr:helix-turn-helix domain-containing protein [Nitriliruptor alkaliphilus]
MAKDYGQFCGLARALDVVGDRWTLLIVRELLMGPARFRDLQHGLPGIATNLLTERLARLAELGIITRSTEATRPIYELTEFGEGLREPVEAFVRWSAPLMISGPGDDHADPRWLTIAVPALLEQAQPDQPGARTVQVDDVTLRITSTGDGVAVNLLPDGDHHGDIDHRATMPQVLGAAFMSRSFDDFLRAL